MGRTIQFTSVKYLVPIEKQYPELKQQFELARTDSQQMKKASEKARFHNGAGSRTRTYEGRSREIYSLLSLPLDDSSVCIHYSRYFLKFQDLLRTFLRYFYATEQFMVKS